MTLPFFFPTLGYSFQGFSFQPCPAWSLIPLRPTNSARRYAARSTVCVYTHLYDTLADRAEWRNGWNASLYQLKKTPKGKCTHTVSKERERKIWWESVKHRQSESNLGERKKRRKWLAWKLRIRRRQFERRQERRWKKRIIDAIRISCAYSNKFRESFVVYSRRRMTSFGAGSHKSPGRWNAGHIALAGAWLIHRLSSGEEEEEVEANFLFSMDCAWSLGDG
jgi:hypothetical protein